MALSLSQFKHGNWLMTIVVVIVVLVLFFIPDIIGFEGGFKRDASNFSLEIPKVSRQGDLISKDPAVGENEEAPAEEEEDFQEELAQRAPLDRVSYMLNRRRGSMTADEEEDSSINGTSRERSTWAHLSSKKTKRTLTAIQSRARGIAAGLPAEKESARYALYNLAGGIEEVMNSSEKNMTAKAAVDYLEYLDMEVTRAFVKDRVDRADFDAWSKISLTSVIGRKRAEKYKKDSKPSFRPVVHLTDVRIFTQANHQGRFIPSGPAFVSFDGYVEGRDINRVALHHNGSFLRDLPMHRSARDKNVFEISFRQGGADGVYTIYAYDEDGNEYSKHYDFSRVRKIPRWQYAATTNLYTFLIPVSGGKPDAYFAAGGSGAERGNAVFSSLTTGKRAFHVF